MSQVHDAAGTGRPATAAGWLRLKKRKKTKKKSFLVEKEISL
jgi:hypothetical protein